MKGTQVVTGVCTFRKRCVRRWAARRFGSRVSGRLHGQLCRPIHDPDGLKLKGPHARLVSFQELQYDGENRLRRFQ
jgi:hypothetical protein